MSAPVGVSFALSGFEPLLERLAGLEARFANPEPALEIVADLLEAHVAKTFDSQGAEAGAPWQPLAASTVRMRARRTGYYRLSPSMGAGSTGPILTWTGRGRRSFARGGAGHVRMVSASGLVWGSTVDYLRYHQHGGGRLPRRVVLGFRDAFQQRELVFQPLRLWLQGVPAGAIRTVMQARTGLATAAA